VARYNWEELKKEFILGDYKSLREFAERKGLKYDSGNFRMRTKGWNKEKSTKEAQKRHEIIEKVVEKQVEREIDYNLKHLETWSKILDVVAEVVLGKDQHLATKSGKINVYALEKLANVMEKVQKGQRLALGLSEEERPDDGSIEGLIEAIQKARDE
jgi:hypothetical protein